MDDCPDPPVASRPPPIPPSRRARRGRPQGSGADDLDRYRAKITQMRASNESLCDIMAELRQTDGVVASENQYKRKLAKWGLSRRYKSASHPCVDSGQNPNSPGPVEDKATRLGKITVPDHEKLWPERVFNDSDAMSSYPDLIEFIVRWRDIFRAVHPTNRYESTLKVAWSWRSVIRPSSATLVPTFLSLSRSPDRPQTNDLPMKEIQKFGFPPSYSLRSGSMSHLLMIIKELRSSNWAWEQNLDLSCDIRGVWITNVELFPCLLQDAREDTLWLLPYLDEVEQRNVISLLDTDTLVECLLLWLSSQVRHSAELIGKPILRVILPLEERLPDELMTAHWVLDKLSPHYQAVVGHSKRAQVLLRLLPCVTEEAANMVPYCDAVGCQPSECAIFGGARGSLSHSHDTLSFSHTEQIRFFTQNGLSSELRPVRRWFISQYEKVEDSCSWISSLRNGYWHEKKHPKYPSHQYLRKPRRFRDVEWESSAWDGAMSSLYALAQGTAFLDVHDVILLICLALATKKCGLASRGRRWSESNELLVADLQRWVSVVKHHAYLAAYGSELDWTEDFCSIVYSTWRLRVFDDGIPGRSETCAMTLTRMLGAARHLIKLTLAALGIKPGKQSWRAADVSEPDEQAPQNHCPGERVQPGKDPPDLRDGIAAFVAVATTAVSALGFILGLILCMVSVIANLIECTSPASTSPVQQSMSGALIGVSTASISFPTMLSRPATPEFEVWLPQLSGGRARSPLATPRH